MPLGKWKRFAKKDYRLVDLGRPAIFLLPARKLQKKLGKSTVEKHLRHFLMKNFSAFTTSLIPAAGFWKADGSRIFYDKCQQYEVSFVGKERIPKLLKELARIAAVIDEECIYFKAGQYSCLVYPPPKKMLPK